MMMRKSLFFLIIFWLTIPIFASNRSKVNNQFKILVTKRSIFNPITKPTRSKSKSGFCWINSAVINRPDVWRCMVDNNIFDPCFVLESREKVVCGADPSKNNHGFLLNLTRPLPKIPKFREHKTDVWMLMLENG